MKTTTHEITTPALDDLTPQFREQFQYELRRMQRQFDKAARYEPAMALLNEAATATGYPGREERERMNREAGLPTRWDAGYASLPKEQRVVVEAAYHFSHWRDVDVVVRVDHLDGFSELVDIAERFEALTVDGWERHSDDATLRRRTLHGKLAVPDGDPVPFRLLAFISTDAEECKVIETGEVEPVRKFVCPGDADYPEPAAAAS